MQNIDLVTYVEERLQRVREEREYLAREHRDPRLDIWLKENDAICAVLEGKLRELAAEPASRRFNA